MALSVVISSVIDMSSPTVVAPRPRQDPLPDVGTPLHDVTFVVVDLETTGSSAAEDQITEIGAVKVRAGQVLGEFQTLVNPHVPIPGVISVLTGITDAMVATAPPLRAALPAFLEFAAGTVIVAHNARFDVGFLKAACVSTGASWPDPVVVDTVHLARALVTADESPNHRLSSLARVFRASVTPDHRALHDAQATVDVLHGLIARVGGLLHMAARWEEPRPCAAAGRGYRRFAIRPAGSARAAQCSK